MNILVTGASGFIGSNFIKYTNHCIKRVVRNKSLHNHFEDCYYINDFSSNTDWDKAFRDVEVVLHLGALVHRKPKIFSQSYLNNILEANSFATSRFVREASLHGVRRFIFLSTIGVYGQFSNQPFTELDLTFPNEPYSISKLIAEGCLQNICSSSTMDYVIIRPPMVYGPNAPGNFKRLVNLIKYGFPLPISNIKNKRSLLELII